MPSRNTFISLGVGAGIVAFFAFLVLSFYPAYEPDQLQSWIDTRDCLDRDPSLTYYGAGQEPFVSIVSGVEGEVDVLGLQSRGDQAALFFFESEDAAADGERRLRDGTDRQILREGFEVLVLRPSHVGGPAPYARCIFAEERHRWDVANLNELLGGGAKASRPFL